MVLDESSSPEDLIVEQYIGVSHGAAHSEDSASLLDLDVIRYPDGQ